MTTTATNTRSVTRVHMEFYLASLLAVDPDVWGGLASLLQPDTAS